MPGGKLRPPTGIGPPVVSPAAGGVAYANVSRHCPAVSSHVVGTQAALIPYHVWNRLGCGIPLAAGWVRGGLPQRTREKPEGTWFRHFVRLSRTHSCSRGQPTVGADMEF